MSAYLQPGDKVHIEFPLQGSMKEMDSLMRKATEAYKAKGIEVFIWTMGDKDSSTHVVSVIRSPKAVPVPPWRQDPLLDEVNLDPNR